jgi:hypothetical protein
MEGGYDDPPFATHGEIIGRKRGCTRFFERWSDGQMTMGAQQKRSKFSQFVCVRVRLRRSARRFASSKNIDRVERSEYIYDTLSGCTHVGGSYRNVLARLLDRTLTNTD